MGFDLSEFYEIYGHDLEVEARQEQQRFQQRLLGWVQTWSNALCALYDTAVNRVRTLAPEDWPLADLFPKLQESKSTRVNSSHCPLSRMTSWAV